ncbi:MAG: type II toxin-antitoxin system RelE/ParE family toxin, partial [bacterium]|nr:type II toxin-antitoxin system RelE/ParE family toxin [bacterium]
GAMCPSRRSDEEGQSQIEQIILDYHPDAIDELIDAAQFYESRQAALGYRFLDAVDAALETIKKNPLIWRADELGRRKCRVKKFPYLLIYKMSNKFAYILAVSYKQKTRLLEIKRY